MSDTTVIRSGGVGFSGLLAIAFIVLKLCNVIDWSWLWVLAPIWIPFVLVVGIFLVIGIIMLIVMVAKACFS